MRTPTDSRGRHITLGACVAYNRSGDVISGRVVGISAGHIKIEPDDDFAHPWHKTSFSRVKNFRSILVLSVPVDD